MSYGRPVTNPHLRVSDAERGQVADLLKRHCADGRLDAAEFEGRLERALQAKTRADLAGLLDDLPSLNPPERGQAPHPWRPRRGLGAVAIVVLVALLAVSAASTLVSFVRFRVPWLVVAIVVFALWRRRHHGYRSARSR